MTATKGKLFNDGHTITSITGIDFDGTITCHHTEEKRNRFIYRVVDDNKLDPGVCPLCGRPLTPTIKLGVFQQDEHETPYDRICAG